MSTGEPSSTPPGAEPVPPPLQPDPDTSEPPGAPASAVPGLGSTDSTGASTSDWPAQATDMVVALVERVRDSTTGPALTIMRGVVYGTAAVILAVTALVLLTIAGVRIVDAYLPGEVWSAHLLIGGLFTIVGLVLWSRRRSPTA